MAEMIANPFNYVLDETELEDLEISETDNESQPLVGSAYYSLTERPSDLLCRSKRRPHKALGMVERSLMAQRPANRAVFFLYGLTGSGKTSTLKHLFNGTKYLFNTSSKESATRSIIEHIYPLKSEYWDAENLQISFIDSPGFGDTNRVKQDAINLALIEEFMAKHPQLGLQELKWLGCRYQYIVYPNIVMIVVDVNDERMLGYESRVASMFRVLKKNRLHLIDKKRPNVVIVLTHVCCLPKKTWTSKLESKAYFVQLLARRFFKIHVPVVYIENEFEDYDLEMTGDFSLLYNGVEQPKNLFKTCINIMRASQDEVGIEAVRIFFRTKLDEISHSIPVNEISIESFSDNALFDQKKEYFFTKLSVLKADFEPTKVTQMIDEYVQTSNDPRNKGKKLDEELYPLKFILIKRGFKRPEDLHSKTLSEVEIVLHPYKFNELESWVLYDVFKVKTPVIQKISTNLGHGYDLLKETVMEKLVLFLEPDLPVPPYGFLIPGNCQCQFFTADDINFICRHFSQMSDYNEERLEQLDLLNYADLLTFKPPPGFNVIYPNDVSKNVEISFVVEKVLNSIRINLKTHKLAQSFQDHIKDIPDSFDESNSANVDKFDHLFAKFGSCFVSTVSIGGYICGKFVVSRDRALETDYFSYLRQWLINIILNNKAGISVEEFLKGTKDIEKEILFPYYDLQSAELEWFGGDPRYYQTTLKNLSQRQWLSWEESVNYNPVILPLHLYPRPIFHVVENSEAIQDAFEKQYLKWRRAKFKTSTFRKSWLFKKHTRNDESECAKTSMKEINNFCFSGNSTVQLSTGQIIAMKDLHIGDKVLSVSSEGKPCFSPVYLWGHLDPGSETEYLCISYSHGEIRVSANHLVFVRSREDGGVCPIPASRVCAGDLLQHVCVSVVDSVQVLEVRRVREMGVYSPFTLTSRIVVDGVLCSVFAVPEVTVGDTSKAHDRGHIIMAPLRLGFRTGLCKWVGFQMNDKMHIYCSALEKLYYMFRPLETLFQ